MSERTLSQHVSDFIQYKRSLGYVYEGQDYVLGRYARFAEPMDSVSVPTKESVNGFLDSLSEASGTLYQAVGALREFSRYLQSIGYHNAYMIPPKMASQPIPEDPYFFTEKEIEAFFKKWMAYSTINPLKGEILFSRHCSDYCTVAGLDARKSEPFSVKTFMQKNVISISFSQRVQKVAGFSLAMNCLIT